MRGIAISLCLHQRGHRETPFSPSSVTSLDKNRGLIQKANLGSVAWTGWNRVEPGGTCLTAPLHNCFF